MSCLLWPWKTALHNHSQRLRVRHLKTAGVSAGEGWGWTLPDLPHLVERERESSSSFRYCILYGLSLPDNLHSLFTPLVPITYRVGKMPGGFDRPLCPEERDRVPGHAGVRARAGGGARPAPNPKRGREREETCKTLAGGLEARGLDRPIVPGRERGIKRRELPERQLPSTASACLLLPLL